MWLYFYQRLIDTFNFTVTDPPDDTESDPSSPVTTCFDVKYSVDGMPISPQQVQVECMLFVEY